MNSVSTSATLYYIHDPMCSWCWGYQPTWQQLRAALPSGLLVKNLLGGLAADTDEPMPQALQEKLQSIWRTIEQQLGASFNFDFWIQNQPRRTTYPACRAVLAAAAQGQEDAMIAAIQRAYYVRALNPSDGEVLLQLAGELALDVDQFARDMASAVVAAELQRQISQARHWPIAGFPSLVLVVDAKPIPIALDYLDYRTSLADVNIHLT